MSAAPGLSEAFERAGVGIEHVHDASAIADRAMSPSVRAMAVEIDLLDRPCGQALSEWQVAGLFMPVIFLLSPGMTLEVPQALGFDLYDFLFKPWRVEDVLARVNALLVRQRQAGVGVLRHGDLSLNTLSKEVVLAGDLLELTALEYRMLRYFMTRPRYVISQAELVGHLYSNEDVRGSNTIEVYVSRLRRRIGAWRIRTIRGLGYRFG